MSVDYDRLRELVDEHTPGPWEQAPRGQIGNRELRAIVALVGGDESGEEIGDCNLEADRELIALAPDMARELLALRDGVKQVADELGEKADYAPNIPRQAAYTEAEQRLNHLLEGDTA